MTRETERLAREIVRADVRIVAAAARFQWDEVETWTETRQALREERSALMRSQWVTGEWVWPEPLQDAS